MTEPKDHGRGHVKDEDRTPEIKERRKLGQLADTCPHCDRLVGDEHWERHQKMHGDDDTRGQARDKRERERPPPDKRRPDEV